MPGDPLFEAFVRLRALNDGSFEREARAGILPGVERLATDAAGVVAAKKIFDFAKAGLAELGEAQKVAAQTNAVIRSTGGEAGISAPHVDELATSLAKLSGKDDE